MASASVSKKTLFSFFILLPEEQPSVPYILAGIFPAKAILPIRMKYLTSLGLCF
jgi:hypothetical protein